MNHTISGMTAGKQHTVVIVGGGAAGISVAASLHKRDSNLDIAIIEPSDTHHYQPGWTMVGGGVFRPEVTARPMSDRSEEHTSELQSRPHLVCRLLLEKKKK